MADLAIELFELENDLFTRLFIATAYFVMAVAMFFLIAAMTAVLMDIAGFISLSHFSPTTWPANFPLIGGHTVMEGIARITLVLAGPILALCLYYCFHFTDEEGMRITQGTGVRWGLPVVLAFGLVMAFLWMARPTVGSVSLLDHKTAVPEPAPNVTGSLKLFKPCEKGMCSDVQ